MASMVSVHFVLCPIAYFIFIRHLVKEKLWGKVTCEIHVHGNDLWICFAGYRYFFFQGCVWIECPLHIDFLLRARSLLYGNTFQKHQKWESLGNSYGRNWVKMKNEISEVQLVFHTNFTFYNFDDEGKREVIFLRACSWPGTTTP